MARKMVAIVGSYRKGGTVDCVVDAVLSGARELGVETSKIYLIDQHIEYCRNCRSCTQNKGVDRQSCAIQDDVAAQGGADRIVGGAGISDPDCDGRIESAAHSSQVPGRADGGYVMGWTGGAERDAEDLRAGDGEGAQDWTGGVEEAAKAHRCRRRTDPTFANRRQIWATRPLLKTKTTSTGPH